MKISIVIAVLDSHEIVRRQVLHWFRLDLPPDVEILLMDDGSSPPIQVDRLVPNLQVIPTNDFRPWTTGIARNTGSRLARGEYLLMTDIDHILSRKLIDAVRFFDGDKMQFRRQFGVLDQDGVFTQDMATLKSYGLQGDTVETQRHGNSFAIRKSVFEALGRYNEERSALPYPSGEERLLNRKWQDRMEAGEFQHHVYGPPIYVFPQGRFCGDEDYNPFGLFHNLSRKR